MRFATLFAIIPILGLSLAGARQPTDLPAAINVSPKHFSTDKSVKLDYDIVYVRAPRKGDAVGTNWTEISNPVFMDPGADLMLLHPDGSEELLVKGGVGSVTDPMVSFDGEWVFYTLFHDLRGASTSQGPPAGADIFKIHVKSKKIVRLTQQQFTPNTGAANWSKDYRTPEPGKDSIGYGVFNMGPCPLPGGKLIFTSNRNGFKPPKRLPHTLQLFVMDDDGTNVECIGHLNLGMALHPVVLRDGRVMFSSLESQGLRASTLWGLWNINPDGTGWGPMASAFLPGASPSAWHFQTQLSDVNIVAEEYYNQTSTGFGGFVKFPAGTPSGEYAFGPGFTGDPRNPPLRNGRLDNGQARVRRLPFSPFGIESLTLFARTDEGPADFSVLGSRSSTRVGKVSHPSAAPDNHLLCVWSPGPVNGGYTVHQPAVDGGLYLIKDGKAINEPGEMLLIKNDPKFNEQWPRALVPYKRIHGVDEPVAKPPAANDGKLSPHLPAGTPFGLVGTSSLYKRESYPNGVVKPGSVTASFAGGTDPYQDLDPFNTTLDGVSLNWFNQGADAGRYSNEDIHAIRILAMEPTTDRQHGPNSGRTFRSHASERLRILGEIPVRKFVGDKQSLDPDGNPDTSFLAKIPADVAFTFQTLDKNGMVLNMAQTWHQVRPGEIRHDCGGCHAHSQKPTDFNLTLAAKPDYKVFDLTTKTPLLTSKANDESKQKWDAKDETGLKFAVGVKNVEFWRDVKPILERSCAACHRSGEPGASATGGNLILNDDKIVNLPDCDDVPGTYYRLAMDSAGRFGHKPIIGSWRGANASRYIRMFQSRRSLLVWKIYGERLDGWSNDDFPTETTPGDARTLKLKGEPVPNTLANRNRADLDYTGSAMPPGDAVRAGKVAPLTDEDKLTLVRWIDLGCPIDLSYDPKNPAKPGFGWMLDDQRPTLTLTSPRAGANPPLERILIGMYDYGSGLDAASFEVIADFAVNGVPAGQNLAPKFKSIAPGVFELPLAAALTVESGKLAVSVKDKQGNVTRIERTFSAGK
jgi:Hydrazine synthase alpha subunit middle domain